MDRLLREYKVEANVGAPQVAYKETITKQVEQDTKGSGNSIDSRMMGCFSSQRVSPVVEFFRPITAAPFSALAFKIATDPYVGRLSFVRVYSGMLNTGTSVLNSTKKQKERIGRILQMHANHREDIETVYSGASAGRESSSSVSGLTPWMAGMSMGEGI